MRGTTLLTALLLAASSVRAEFELYLFEGTEYTGTSKVYESAGKHSLGFTASSWLFYNESPPGCCVTFCKGDTQTGYRCNADSSDSDVPTKYRFNRVVVQCGGDGPEQCF
jgi:hypothetical protein